MSYPTIIPIASLEKSERLKSLGYPQSTMFGWYSYINLVDRIHEYNHIDLISSRGKDGLICAAPTVCEAMQWLPRNQKDVHYDEATERYYVYVGNEDKQLQAGNVVEIWDRLIWLRDEHLQVVSMRHA